MIRLDPSVWRTIATLFVTTYAFHAMALRGGLESAEFPLWVGASMFLPAVFTLLHLKRSGAGWKSIPWRRGPWRYLLLSLTLPAILTLAGLGLFTVTGLGEQPYLFVDEQGGISTELGLLFTGESMGLAHFASSVLASGVVMSLVTGLLTVGEEIGWRGFLQPKLLERNRLFPSVVFLGLLWAFWHVVVILAGFNYPRTPILGALVFFPVAGVGVSAWLAWLTLKAGSIWPAAFFHAGVNSVGTLVFEMDFGARDLLGQSAISFTILATGLGILRIGVGPQTPQIPAYPVHQV